MLPRLGCKTQSSAGTNTGELILAHHGIHRPIGRRTLICRMLAPSGLRNRAFQLPRSAQLHRRRCPTFDLVTQRWQRWYRGGLGKMFDNYLAPCRNNPQQCFLTSVLSRRPSAALLRSTSLPFQQHALLRTSGAYVFGKQRVKRRRKMGVEVQSREAWLQELWTAN